MKPLLTGLFIVLAGLAGAFLLLRPTQPDYIFLITLDTTRADHVDYSLENTITPELAELAATGVIFPRAYALTPITLPSHAAMFYSQPPHRLQALNNMQRYTAPQPALAQLFRSAGYRTGAVISLGVLQSGFQLDPGFEEYHQEFRPGVWYRTAAEVNRDAFGMIDRLAGEKAFFWIHYSDPHGPYFPPCYTGTFQIHQEDRAVFSCDSIDQRAVQLTVMARPGINTIRFKSDIPNCNGNPAVDIEAFSYMNFSVTSTPETTGLSVRLPMDWKKTVYKNNITYFTKKREATLRFTNPGMEEVAVSLSFVYKILTDLHATRDLYREEVRYMDRQFGELIAFLKKKDMLEDCFFLIMGDHGEGLGEHRELVGHMHYLNKLYVHVPMFMAGKGVGKEGVRNSRLVSNLQVAPTLLKVAGIKKPTYMTGDTLFDRGDGMDILLLETHAPQAYLDGYSLIRSPYQIVHHPEREENRYEFFDLERDPLGINNLWPELKNQKAAVELFNSVTQISRAIGAMKTEPETLSEEQKNILKSLGYL